MSRATRLAGVLGRLGTADFLRFTPTTLTPAGSNSQSGSTPAISAVSILLTATTTTRGVKLQEPIPGDLAIAFSARTTNSKIYPFASGKLGLAATMDANQSLGAGKAKLWFAASRTQWYLIGST